MFDRSCLFRAASFLISVRVLSSKDHPRIKNSRKIFPNLGNSIIISPSFRTPHFFKTARKLRVYLYKFMNAFHIVFGITMPDCHIKRVKTFFHHLKAFCGFCGFFMVAVWGSAVCLAQMKPIGDIDKITGKEAAGVTFATTSGALVSVTYSNADIVRIRISPAGKFEPDQSYAFAENYKPDPPQVKIIERTADLELSSADGSRVLIRKKPFFIEIYDAEGRPVLKDAVNRPVLFDPDSGEIQATKSRPSELETYYGFGEKAFQEMSRNGKFIVNWNTDTFSYPVGTDPIYQSIPFFYGLYDGRAYGLFLNNTYRTFFDMGKTAPERFTFGAAGGELDYFVFIGGRERSPQKVLQDYTHLTGRTPLPPIWALGNQQSRWSYFPEKRVKEIAAGYRNNKIPADVIYLDIDYMDDYRVFTWNKERFPDPKRMISELREDGFRTVLIIDPGIKVDPDYHTYAEGRRLGMFVKNPDGSELQRDVWPKASAFPDFTDPKARDWFGMQYKAHLQEGVAGFWNDMNEPGVFMTAETEKPEIFHHPAKTFPYDTPHVGDGLKGDHRRYHNVYGMLMTRSTFEGLRRLSPKTRPFVLTRAGFAGVQRYSAVWTGDNYASWDHLAMTIPMLANMSVSGVPFVGGDVGGFNDMPSGELYARWLQAAVLTPFLRSHSVGWVGNKEPWEYGDEFTDINRKTVELRYRLLPYLYTLFRQHEIDGSPIMRPLWYEFPDDKAVYLNNDQFMVGSDIMVAPVVKEGMRTRGIYLPAGAEWIDWWTGEKYESGKTHYLQTPLDMLPLFMRVGAVVATQDLIQHTGEMPSAKITLHVAAGVKPGSTYISRLYQDAGEGYDYRNGVMSDITIAHSPGKLMIERKGRFRGQQIGTVVVHGINAKPRSVMADGKSVEVRFDAEKKRLEFNVDANINEIILVR